MNNRTVIPIHELPPDYHEVRHLVATEPRTLLVLNLLSLVPIAIALGVVGMWSAIVRQLRGTLAGGEVSPIIGLVIVFAVVFTVHEGIHGLFIWLYGHKPHFGFKPQYGVFYATANDALFPRNPFLVIALAPLVVMTVAGLLLMVVVPDALGYYLGLVIVLNAGGAIGDLWMSAVVLRYPAYALVRDEADSIRVYMPER
jgi:type III secretory pathway component EscS